MLLWLAMLLATDLADDDPTLLAVCSFENDPTGFAGGGAAGWTATVPVSADGVFSPKSQYVVTFPLPCGIVLRDEMEKKIEFSLVRQRRGEYLSPSLSFLDRNSNGLILYYIIKDN